MDSKQFANINNVATFDPCNLSTKWLGKKIKAFDQVDSTQTIAKKIATQTDHGTIVLANIQFGGRGRLARSWYSSSEDGLWMSIILKPTMQQSHVFQLTLLSSIAVVQMLNEHGIPAKIKWPNDCLVNGKKISGILTEASSFGNHLEYVVIGIGINLFQSKEDFPNEVRQLATSMKMNTEQDIVKFDVLNCILQKLELLLELYAEHGFHPIRDLWLKYSASIGKEVIVVNGTSKSDGRIAGLSEDGYLLLQRDSGEIEAIIAGDVHFL